MRVSRLLDFFGLPQVLSHELRNLDPCGAFSQQGFTELRIGGEQREALGFLKIFAGISREIDHAARVTALVKLHYQCASDNAKITLHGRQVFRAS